jgi:hypothetical protein
MNLLNFIFKVLFKGSVIVPVSTSQTTQQKNIPAMGGNAGTGKKYGRCPSALTLQNPRSVVACARDSECPGAEKCCDTSSGRVCALPEKTNGSFHLIKRYNFAFFYSLCPPFVRR